jgi:hypothetical protein
MKIALTITLLAAQVVHAGEPIRCPKVWTEAQGWIKRGAAPGGHVTSAGVMLGPADGNGDLRGLERKKDREVLFPGLNDYVDPLQKWAYCSYGPDVRLLRRLPDSTGECVARIGESATVQCK